MPDPTIYLGVTDEPCPPFRTIDLGNLKYRWTVREVQLRLTYALHQPRHSEQGNRLTGTWMGETQISMLGR